MKVQPYLYFNGNCEEAFTFYSKVLGLGFQMTTHKDIPGTSPEWASKVLHASLQIGETMLMGSDAPPDRYSKPGGFSVCLNVESVEETERLFAELSIGGAVMMPIQETFWAHRFAMFSDKFGTPWMVGFNKPIQG
jgi:PhnB protein